MSKKLLAAGMLLWAAFAHAESTTSSVDDTMVVFARSEFVNSIADIPSNVTVVTRDEIEKSNAKSLEALLKGRAGIQVSDSNSGASFSLRGLSGEQAANNVLVLLDGRRLNSLDLTSPNLNFIQLNDIESIEILSGSAGVLYGDQAVGGVINIVTRSSKDDRVTVSASYGSFDSVNANVATSGAINDKTSYRFSATQDNSDSYRKHNASQNGALMGRVDYENTTRKAYLELGYYDTEREYAGSLTKEQFETDPTQVNPSNKDDYSHAYTRVARLGFDLALSDDWLLKNEFIIDDTTEHGAIWGGATNVDSGQAFLSSQVEGKHDTSAGEAYFLFGVDAGKAEYDYKSSFTDRDIEQRTLNVYSQYKYPLIEDLVFTVGGRYGRVKDDLNDQAVYPDGVKLKDDANAYELALNYQISKKSRVYVRTESNFRFAKISEQAYTPANVVGLKPQTGLSNELGWHYTDSDYSIRIDVFNLQLEDEIVFLSSAAPPNGGLFNGANVNADASERNGASIYGDYYINEDFLVSAEYSFVDAEVTEGEDKDKDVPWVANHTARVGMNYFITDSVDVYSDAVYTGSMYQAGDYSNSSGKVSAYWLVNLAVNYNINESLTLSGSLENVFDEQYASYVQYDGYYPRSERAFYVTGTYQF
ncbi:TonB-dependent receptor [Grimontia sp. NTOU-MAR1]|uniref:TonB-dependent receptor n=1 Tax=Grimontia sp. NTOU-MAR1 TaxID=3111011 RepID=UPI002DB908EE|nr:TonB-dependent receptor [Grimontia sp. NTOU-MAR1]WRV96565.1 TonB-dependent receptor [Grimontia sp. NTOU-MAR1]